MIYDRALEHWDGMGTGKFIAFGYLYDRFGHRCCCLGCWEAKIILNLLICMWEL